MVVAYDNTLESRLIVVVIYQIWEFSFIGAIGWLISCSIPGLSAKDSGSDFYHGIAHAFEYLSNQWSCLEALHPALALCMLLEISSVKGWLEALHPNPFVCLVCKLVCNLVHSLDHALVAVIESNNWSELDFQLPSLDLWMHLHDLLKDRVPISPRTWKELSLHSINSFSMLQWFFKCSQCSIYLGNLAKTWVW